MKSLVTVLIILLITQTGFGQDGSFDNTFGQNGVQQFSIDTFNTRGAEIIYMPDSSILISGACYHQQFGAQFNRGLFLSKFLTNGSLDLSFGTNGTLFIPNGANGNSNLNSMVLLPDGNILCHAVIDGNYVLFKINQNGVIDSTYGNNGIVNIDNAGWIAYQSTGKVIIVGHFFDGYNYLYHWSRYKNDGSIDSTFGINGIMQTSVTSYRFDLCHAIKVQADNKIIAVGTSYESATQRRAVIVRINENGTFDNTFGNNGVVITPIGANPGYAIYNDVDLLPDGKIMAGGIIEYAGGTGGFGGTAPAVVKYNSDGTIDATYGNNGEVVLSTINNANDYLRTIKTQADYKTIIGGNASNPFPIMQSDYYLTRLDSNGNVDLTFGVNGAVLSDFDNAETNYVQDIVIQDDGKILTIGSTKDTTNQFVRVVLCRFNNETLLTVDDIKQDDNFLLYPNPIINELTISTTKTPYDITMYNSIGQIFYLAHSINESSKKYNVSTYNKGILIIRIKNEKDIYYYKIVKN